MKPIDVVVALLVPAVVFVTVRLLILRDELVNLQNDCDERENRLQALERAIDPCRAMFFSRHPMLDMMGGKGKPTYAQRGLLQRLEALEAAAREGAA